MSGFSQRARRSFEVAGDVFRRLEGNGVGAAVIGSIALAVHGYVRATRDLDLGVAVLSFRSLAELAGQLRDDGYDVHLGEPGPDDPLGGIVTVSGQDFDPVQIVNLRAPDGRYERLAREAIASAGTAPELGMPVIDLPHLVALKLVAGSRKDELDVLELLRANPDAPRERILETCARFRLRTRLERLLAGESR